MQSVTSWQVFATSLRPAKGLEQGLSPMDSVLRPIADKSLNPFSSLVKECLDGVLDNSADRRTVRHKIDRSEFGGAEPGS